MALGLAALLSTSTTFSVPDHCNVPAPSPFKFPVALLSNLALVFSEKNMGGGAMRTAAKAAAFAGYRSPSAATYRRTSLPPAATASVHVAAAGESGPSISVSSSEVSPAVQWPVWDIDDWEFAGGKEANLLDSAPRLVFGSAPTLEEAKEATSDLKEALEKVYFSSGIAEGSINVRQVSNPSGSAAILPAVPKQVVQAFSLLQGSPEVQNVVASLASDKNVWDAVMKNEKVMEFYKNHQSILPPETNLAPEESIGRNESPKESTESVESCTKEKSGGSVFFTDLVQNIKAKVSEMVSNISNFLQDFMGTSTENCGPMNTETSKSTAENYVDLAVGASFIALAIAAILVVLVKRG